MTAPVSSSATASAPATQPAAPLQSVVQDQPVSRDTELRLDMRFVDADVQTEKRAEFLRVVDDAAFVVGNAQTTVSHDPVALASLADTLSWLAGRRIAAQESRTIAEWAAEAEAVRVRLQETSTIVAAAERTAPPPTQPVPVPDVQAIITRLEAIAKRISAVHLLVEQQGFAVPDDVHRAAENVRLALDQVPSCPSLKTCRPLAETVTALIVGRIVRDDGFQLLLGFRQMPVLGQDGGQPIPRVHEVRIQFDGFLEGGLGFGEPADVLQLDAQVQVRFREYRRALREMRKNPELMRQVQL